MLHWLSLTCTEPHSKNTQFALSFHLSRSISSHSNRFLNMITKTIATPPNIRRSPRNHSAKPKQALGQKSSPFSSHSSLSKSKSKTNDHLESVQFLVNNSQVLSSADPIKFSKTISCLLDPLYQDPRPSNSSLLSVSDEDSLNALSNSDDPMGTEASRKSAPAHGFAHPGSPHSSSRRGKTTNYAHSNVSHAIQTAVSTHLGTSDSSVCEFPNGAMSDGIICDMSDLNSDHVSVLSVMEPNIPSNSFNPIIPHLDNRLNIRSQKCKFMQYRSYFTFY